MTSKSILKIKRDDRSEIENRFSNEADAAAGGQTNCNFAQRGQDMRLGVNSTNIKDPNAPDSTMIKCNNFLVTNLKDFSPVPKKASNRSTLGSR